MVVKDPQQLVQELNGLSATERCSLVRHLDQARPYLTPATYQAWSEIEHLVAASADHARRLTVLMERLGEEPSAGSFKSEVANYHYLDLATLSPLLVEEKTKQIEAYQRAIALAEGDAKIVEELKSLLSGCESQLQLIESFSTAKSQEETQSPSADG